jgi:hypothetical protein
VRAGGLLLDSMGDGGESGRGRYGLNAASDGLVVVGRVTTCVAMGQRHPLLSKLLPLDPSQLWQTTVAENDFQKPMIDNQRQSHR